MTLALSYDIIDIVFLAVFAILLPANLYNLARHGNGKRLAYISLVIFDLIRISGNALLVAAYRLETKGVSSVAAITSLYTGGYVLQSTGYSALFIATLYLQARGAGGDGKNKRSLPRLLQFQVLHVLNIVSTVLLIVGITHSSGLFGASSAVTVSPMTKAGSYLYCAITAVLGMMIIYHLFYKGPISWSAKIVLSFCLVAMVPMCIRVGYATYRIQAGKFVDYNPWAHLVCQDLVETATVIIYIVLGFFLASHGGDNDLGERVQETNISPSLDGSSLEQDVDLK